jgi:aminobenzoyl-glutamate utilization protein B
MKRMRKTFCIMFAGMVLIHSAFAQRKPVVPATDLVKREAMEHLQQGYERYRDISLRIWEYAELGYKEVKSSALLQETLKDAGFRVDAGVAGIPTAFVASYGSGSPVIGILAEYDALPGLSQQAVTDKIPATGRTSGHGCGHHLFGTASVAAGIELKRQLEQRGWKGTIRVYGCPAEEGGSGKVYMVREGLFKDVDAVLHWHPGSENRVAIDGALANKSAKFRFYGRAAHAAASPELGRSALDGVEAMNHMVNMMREHMPSDARIHYVITQGGKAPNVVPDFAEVYYYVRHPDKQVVVNIFDRVAQAATGAALGTETQMKYEIIGGTHDLLINRSLSEAFHRNLVLAGGVQYATQDLSFAEEIRKTFPGKVPPVAEAAEVKALDAPDDMAPGSTDVGDVSYNVPTAGINVATWVPGTPMHSWQAVACGGTEIGAKGMMVAAKALTNMGIELINDVLLIERAKGEFRKKLGEYKYKALLGDRKPALDYRD